MNAYANPNERRVGANRPKILHLPANADSRTRRQRHAEKENVVAERRAIKKAARQEQLKQLRRDLDELNE